MTSSSRLALDAQVSPVSRNELAARGTSDRALAIDTGAIAVISVAICTLSQHALLMTVLVPAVIALRFAARGATRSFELGAARELLFFVGATVLGAFNDYNSVVRRRIYDYHVPTLLPRSWTTIPAWMLLYWGMILRFLAALGAWRRLRGERPRDAVAGVDRPWLKIAIELALVVMTRQSIYRLYLHPWLSWLPFALGIGVVLVLFRPDRRERALLSLFAVGGPLIEVLYIQLGQLHAYHLGWLGGVPLWIALWWVLAFAVWDDLSARVTRRLARGLERPA